MIFHLPTLMFFSGKFNFKASSCCPRSDKKYSRITPQPIYPADEQPSSGPQADSPCISFDSADSNNTSTNPLSPPLKEKKCDISYFLSQKYYSKLYVTTILLLIVAMGIMLLKGTIIQQLKLSQIGKNSQMPASHNRHAKQQAKTKRFDNH